MNRVSISGYGITKFSREDISIESSLLQSTKELFDSNSNLHQKDIEVVLVSTCDNSKYLSSILSELAGIEPKISHSVENLCNSAHFPIPGCPPVHRPVRQRPTISRQKPRP